MDKQYRFCSDAFGEYLERMPVGLIDKFISYLNSYASKGNYSYYFHVGWVLTGKYGTDKVFVIDIYVGTSINEVIASLNKAYYNLFSVGKCNSEIQPNNISISTSDICFWDKYNKTYLRLMRIHDMYFYKFIDDATKFWLNK